MLYRWIAMAVFVAAIGLSARRRRLARRTSGAIARTDEPGGLVAGRILVAVPLYGGVIAWLVAPAWMDWGSFAGPAWLRWAGVLLGVLVIPWLYHVLAALGGNVSETVLTKRGQRLVTDGPYRWVRHPLYTGGLALFAGIGLMASNWFILLWTGVALVAVLVVVVPREEAHLMAAFGDRYRAYRAATGALIPSLRRVRQQDVL